MGPQPLIKQAGQLINELGSDGVSARLLGGVAVALRCPVASPPSPLARSYSDVDIAITRTSRRRLPEVMARLDFTAADRFNRMNGHVRQLYMSAQGVELDVFVEHFKMCHELDLKGRLDVDRATLPLADLMLTKLQVAELTEKDVRDCAALVVDHDLTEDDTGINVTRICAITGSDWGWWRTVTENLGKVIEHVDRLGLATDTTARAASTAGDLLLRIGTGPKTMRWKARARLGDRVAWREEPDEKPRK